MSKKRKYVILTLVVGFALLLVLYTGKHKAIEVIHWVIVALIHHMIQEVVGTLEVVLVGIHLQEAVVEVVLLKMMLKH